MDTTKMNTWSIVTIDEVKNAKQDLRDKKETKALSRALGSKTLAEALRKGTLIIDEKGIVCVPTLPDKIFQFLPDIPQIWKLIGELKEIGRIFEVSESKVSEKSPDPCELKDLNPQKKKPTPDADV